MNKIDFDKLVADDTIIKLSGPLGICHLKDLESEFVIEFLFKHNGFDSNDYEKPKSRIYLKVFFLKGVPSVIFSNTKTILVNADAYEHAIAFGITNNKLDKCVEVKMLAEPEIDGFLTADEINGIKIPYPTL